MEWGEGRENHALNMRESVPSHTKEKKGKEKNLCHHTQNMWEGMTQSAANCVS